MTSFRLPRLATALLAGAGLWLCALAGSASAGSPASRMIEIPAGAVVLVLPPAMMAPAMMAPGFAAADAPGIGDAVPPPAALFAQVDQMMRQAFGGAPEDRLVEAAMRRMQDGGAAGGPVRGVMVTTVSNGRESCTREVTYGGRGMAPTQVRMTGNGCRGEGAPAAAAPGEAVPAAQPPVRTLRVERRHPSAIEVAQLDR